MLLSIEFSFKTVLNHSKVPKVLASSTFCSKPVLTGSRMAAQRGLSFSLSSLLWGLHGDTVALRAYYIILTFGCSSLWVRLSIQTMVGHTWLGCDWCFKYLSQSARNPTQYSTQETTNNSWVKIYLITFNINWSRNSEDVNLADKFYKTAVNMYMDLKTLWMY